MKDVGGIEMPDTWESAPKFGREAMMACPNCNVKTRNFGSTQKCDTCFAEWHKNGNLKKRPPDVPSGCLWVWDDEMLSPNDVLAWGGKGIQRGNIIEF
jgi:hypothetical protein